MVVSKDQRSPGFNAGRIAELPSVSEGFLPYLVLTTRQRRRVRHRINRPARPNRARQRSKK